jgi:hypothetical protein
MRVKRTLHFFHEQTEKYSKKVLNKRPKKGKAPWWFDPSKGP